MNKTHESKQIVLGIDEAYLFPAIVLISSAEASTTHSLKWYLYFFEGDLSSQAQEFVSSWARHQGFDIEQRERKPLPSFDSRRWLSRATFLKLVASDEISGKLLWLDSDVLVLPGWDAIWQEVGDSPGFYAVADIPNDPQGAFNSGVMLWNDSKRLPWIEILRSLPKNRHSSDQVIFNKAYGEERKILSSRFNALWYHIVAGQIMENPVIIHYVGPYKPWHLPMQYTRFCIADACVWIPFYKAVGHLLENSPFARELLSLKRQSERAGRFYFSRVSSARNLSRLFRHKSLTPVFFLLILLGHKFRFIFPPQAMHPFHGKTNVWTWAL